MPIVAANELARAEIRVGIENPNRPLKKALSGVLKSKRTVTDTGSLCRSAGISTSMSSRSTSMRLSGMESSVVVMATSSMRASS